jgi:quercetin dioxygenase-like cupin family protein
VSGYEVAHVDELEKLPVTAGNQRFVWRPVRRRFGISAFGTNVYTAERAGDDLIEEHRERDGHEEMYTVLRGRARFTFGDDTVDAPAGTLVFVRPGTLRKAIAAEDGTAVLAVGAKPGVVFEASPWEDVFVAYSYAESGDVERGRDVLRDAIAKLPDAWQGYFNAACIEARFGDHDEAISLLSRAIELGGGDVTEAARTDSDFDAIRDRDDFPA